MSKADQTLAEAFLDRISRGAVPMGGFYWVDPKALRGQSTETAGAPTPQAQRASATAQHASARRRATAPAERATATGQFAATTARQPAARASQPSANASRAAAVIRRSAALAQRIGLFLIGAHASIRESGETVSAGCTQHARGERL